MVNFLFFAGNNIVQNKKKKPFKFKGEFNFVFFQRDGMPDGTVNAVIIIIIIRLSENVVVSERGKLHLLPRTSPSKNILN